VSLIVLFDYLHGLLFPVESHHFLISV